jgi:DNA excision repair protein ERCC-4
MLEFQKQILTEIVSEDGLLIMSPGLGLFEVICNLMQLYTGGNHLVLVINMSQEQEVLVQRHLVEKGVPYEHTLKPIEYSTSAEQRSLFAFDYCYICILNTLLL